MYSQSYSEYMEAPNVASTSREHKTKKESKLQNQNMDIEITSNLKKKCIIIAITAFIIVAGYYWFTRSGENSREAL